MQLHASFSCIKALIEKGWPEICLYGFMIKSLWACQGDASHGNLFSICWSNDTLNYGKTLIPRALKSCPWCLWHRDWLDEFWSSEQLQMWMVIPDWVMSYIFFVCNLCPAAVLWQLICSVRYSITLIFTSCNLTWTVGKVKTAMRHFWLTLGFQRLKVKLATQYWTQNSWISSEGSERNNLIIMLSAGKKELSLMAVNSLFKNDKHF